ncbi:MAG: GatB/YqeY domain-containing protein [Polyangiales bacterium]
MSLVDTIAEDLKQAMKARDEVKKQTLRMLKSELTTLENPDEIAVLTRAVKSRRDSAQSYREGGREDLAKAEEAEIAIIEHYLPKPLSDNEARDAVRKIIAELGATGKADMGRVMKALMDKHRGQIDGKQASAMVSELLA